MVGDALGRVDLVSVDDYVDAAEEEHPQAGCGDDDVGLEVASGREPDPGLGERLDPVGDDLGPA